MLRAQSLDPQHPPSLPRVVTVTGTCSSSIHVWRWGISYCRWYQQTQKQCNRIRPSWRLWSRRCWGLLAAVSRSFAVQTCSDQLSETRPQDTKQAATAAGQTTKWRGCYFTTTFVSPTTFIGRWSCCQVGVYQQRPHSNSQLQNWHMKIDWDAGRRSKPGKTCVPARVRKSLALKTLVSAAD